MDISSQTLNTLLQQADIEGLIQSGAPEDEYSSEAEIIAQVLKELKENEVDLASISGLIMEVWKQSFTLSTQDLEMRKINIEALADQIVKLLKAKTTDSA